MRFKEVVSIEATKAAVEYPVADYLSPFTRGREVVLLVVKSSDYNAGNLQIETDNATDGSYSDIRAAAVGDAGTAGFADTEWYNVTLGDNLRISSGTYVAGNCKILLLADT